MIPYSILFIKGITYFRPVLAWIVQAEEHFLQIPTNHSQYTSQYGCIVNAETVVIAYDFTVW